MLKYVSNVLLVSVILCVVIGVLVLFPKFDCTTVSFSGNRIVANQRLEEAIQKLRGKNTFMLWINPRFRNRLLEEFSESDSISFYLKSVHHLHILFREKTPWISFLVNQQTVVVSNDGTILSRDFRLVGDMSTNMIVIRGVSPLYFEEEKITPALMKTVTVLVQKINLYFPEKDLQLEYTENGEWVLLLNDTIPIDIGSIDFLDEKFKNLALYFNSVQDNRLIQAMDIRVKDRVLVTYGTE